MQVRSLVTRLGFEADTQAARNYEGAIKSVAQVARRAAAAVGTISAATTALVVQFSNASSETLAWSNRLGIASSRLQSLGFAAQQYQVTNEALTDGLKELSLRTDEFTSTAAGPAQEAFERLGLTVEELNAVSGNTGQLFDLVRGRVADIQDVAARQRIADELFGGQAGEQLSEFLQISGDELERLERLASNVGAVVPRDVLERARQFSRETNTLRATVGGFGKILASELLPAYREFVERTQEYLTANADLIQQNIRQFVDGLVFSLRILLSMLGDIASGVGRVVELIGGWERAISLLVSALVTLAGLRIVKLIGAIGGALWQAKRNAGLLAGAMALLAKTPLIAAFIALVLLAEDVLYWMTEQDSVIGRLVGSYSDLKKSASDALDTAARKSKSTRDRISYDFGRIKRVSDNLGEAIFNAFRLDPEAVGDNFGEILRIITNWGRDLGRDLVVAFTDQIPNWMRDLFGWGADSIDTNPEMQGDSRRTGLEAAREARENSRFFNRLDQQAGPNALVNPPAPAPPNPFGREPSVIERIRETLRENNVSESVMREVNRVLRETDTVTTQTVERIRETLRENNVSESVVREIQPAGQNAAMRDAARSVLKATQMINALNTGDQSDIAAQQSVSSTSSRSVNVNAEVSLQVPQGTREDQRAALEQQTKELFDREMDRVIMNSLWDFQVQE